MKYLPDPRYSDLTNRIIHSLETATDVMTGPEIAEHLNENPVTVRVYLRRLDKRGIVTRVNRGEYLLTC